MKLKLLHKIKILKSRFPLILVLLIVIVIISCNKEQEIVTWQLDSVNQIAGNPVLKTGSPEVINSRLGKAVEFNGKDEGLLIEHNPISGWENFTIEVDLKPYSGYPENIEQRFLHLQDPNNENRRILIELRLNEKEEWYGDWFIKAENESLTLIDSTLTFPVNEWATISLSYENGKVRGYINGEQQVEGEIQYLPVGSNGNVSIGSRMDHRSWFKGAIKEVRFKQGE